MKSIAQFTESENHILTGTFDSFLRFLKMGSVLKGCNAYKTKGTPDNAQGNTNESCLDGIFQRCMGARYPLFNML